MISLSSGLLCQPDTAANAAQEHRSYTTHWDMISRNVSRRDLDERSGMIEIDMVDGTRLRVDAVVNEQAFRRVWADIEDDIMIQVAAGTKVYLACRPVSMRYGFDGLAAQVGQVLAADPFSGHVFIFRSKRADYLKILYYDGTGLCLFAKYLVSH